MIDIKKVEKIIAKRKKEINFLKNNEVLAIAIKNKRKEGELTQSEIAKGICSISYLSKIENGQCHPDNYYVKEIMTKMGMDLSDLNNKDYLFELKFFIDLMFEKNDLEMKRYLEKFITKGNGASAVLIRLGGYLYFYSYPEALKEIIVLNNMLKSLRDYELKALMYFIALYETDKYNFKVGLNYVEILSRFSVEHLSLNVLIDLLKYRIHVYLNHPILAYEMYLKLEKAINEKMIFTRLYDLYFYRILLLIFNELYEEAQIYISKISLFKNAKNNEIYLLRGLIEKAYGNYEEAIEMLGMVKNNFKDESTIYILECCAFMKNASLFRHYEKILNAKEIKSDYLNVVMKVIESSLFDDLYNIKNTITQNIKLIETKSKYNYFYKIFLNYLVEFQAMNSKYKTVMEIQNRLLQK